MTTKTPSKTSDTRDQLRRLMSQHTAATVAARPANPAQSIAAVPPTPRSIAASVPPATSSVKPTLSAESKPSPTPKKTAASGDRCTLRLPASEIAKIDHLILETHQRVGQRMTVSDVLRIGLARITSSLPIAEAEIAALRASDGRRIKSRSE